MEKVVSFIQMVMCMKVTGNKIKLMAMAIIIMLMVPVILVNGLKISIMAMEYKNGLMAPFTMGKYIIIQAS